MNRSVQSIMLLILITVCHHAYAGRPGAPVVSLFSEGQWVELRDFDPVISQRDVRHLWLHRGTLLFNATFLPDGSPYLDAITSSGLPVRLLARKRNNDFYIKNVPDPITYKREPAFHLTRNIFCPQESNPLVLSGNCLNGEEPIGEGYIFNLITVDQDQDGIPDLKQERNYFQVKYDLDEGTLNEIGGVDSFAFDLYSDDVDTYERMGFLYRLDREHPLREVAFLDSNHQPCGSTETSTVKKSTVLKAYTKAEGNAEFKFWTWFKTSIGVGISGEITAGDEDTIKISSAANEATTFRQWGIIFDYSTHQDEKGHQTPFFVEKVIDCLVGEGPPSFGERIRKIEIGVWDSFLMKNIEFEFNRPADLQKVNDLVLDKVDKPVFISVNSSERQNEILETLKNEHDIDHYLATFIFSQLNLACPENVRVECSEF